MQRLYSATQKMFSFQTESRKLNEEVRRLTGGSYIQLSQGVTHYELGNTAGTQTVVLVHGFSVPYFIFDPTFYFLIKNGFRVLRYDLFGRGFSDRPDTSYNIEFFTSQLTDLLDSLRLTGPLSLIGLSMGGPIAAALAACHPERVDRLILIDPAGAHPILSSKILKAAAMPFVGEALFALVVSGSLVRNIASDFFDEKLVAHFQEQYRVQMQYKGFRRAILSTIRNDMLGSFIDIYRTIGSLDIPVMLIWGRHDTTVPLRHSDDLRKTIPNLEFHVIEHCSHIPHFEKPDETNDLLLDFLRRSCTRTY